MSVTLRPLHRQPKPMYFDYILLPFGYKYNNEFLNARKGQKMAFYGGSTVTIDSVVGLPLKSPITDILCRMRYGMPIKRILKVWKDNAVALGNGKGAVNDEQCLMIVFNGEESINDWVERKRRTSDDSAD